MATHDDLIVYVLYHDDYSKAYARMHYGKFKWVKLVEVQTQKYFESYFISKVLPTLKDEWSSKKYVGVMSWKANQKVNINENVIFSRMDTNADVIPLSMFKPSHKMGTMLKWASECHPKFIELWTIMCEHLGYSSYDYLSDLIPAFYYNYWITKVEHLDNYLIHLEKAYTFLNTEPSIQNTLHEDSKYEMDGARGDMSYLTYHCFLLERLPCLYFWTQGLRILPTFITV